MSDAIRFGFEPAQLQKVEVPRTWENYTAITLMAVGVLATVGGAVIGGLFGAHVAPAFLNQMGVAGFAVPIAVGLVMLVAGNYQRVRCNERKLRVEEGEFDKQAEANIQCALRHHRLDPRRFKVLGTPENPIVQKIGKPRYLFRKIFTKQAKYAQPLQQALNCSVTALNKSGVAGNRQEIMAAKYNRFVETSGLLRHVAQEGELISFNVAQRQWGHFVEHIKPNSDDFQQPIYRNGRFYHMANQANHGKEAAKIFFRTQGKRLARAATAGTCLKYFSQGETEDDIYKIEEPVLHADAPTLHHIGHATELLQLGSLNALVDPVFDHLNPVLYPRKTKPGLQPHELPPIDVIMISHNHRDHCDISSLKELVPHQPIVLVPKGDFALFKKLGFTHVQEHDWWSSTRVSVGDDVYRFDAVLARHWSGRNGLDAQKSLTCSWVSHKEGSGVKAIYNLGDSAKIPDDIVGQIQKYVRTAGDEDVEIGVTLLPGGPNHKRGNMETTHQSIFDSMLAHFAMSADPSNNPAIIMHHNAFELGTDRFNEALIIKDQLMTFLDTQSQDSDNDFENNEFLALPKFLRIELRDNSKLAYIKDGIGLDRFISVMTEQLKFPKIGERIELNL